MNKVEVCRMGTMKVAAKVIAIKAHWRNCNEGL
jgi:hypothetical protein